MRSFLVVILFCSSIWAGYKFVVHSWGGTVYVYLGEQRAPAAVRTLKEYSPVNGQALKGSAQRQLVAYAEMERKDSQIGVRLGNPLIRTASGGKEFACRALSREGVYDRVELHFMGVGISTSGETAEMIVETSCESLSDATLLAPIWIPMGKILSAPVKDADYQMPSLNIRLRHMPEAWPESWVLSKVKMYRADDGEYFMEFDAVKMREGRPSLLSFDWK